MSAIGPYQVLKKLGSGGMGEVVLCRDTRLDRRVALKSLTATAAGGIELRDRILREGRAAARLNHPHIAAIYDIVEQDDRAFIVMEYVEGESLAERLAREPMPIDDVFAIGRQLASALAAAHRHGVVHRDLKPGNIQVTPAGSIKVLDFGIARMTPPSASPTATTRSAHVFPAAPDDCAGTPLYMAPEQLLGRQADARSDIYSAGVVLFEMATRRRPHLDTDAFGLAIALSMEAAPAADAVNPDVPSALSRTIARALEREPDRRYQSASELEAALATAADPAPSAALRRQWKPLAAAVLLLSIVVVERGALLAGLGLARGAPAPGGRVVLAILPVDNPGGDLEAEYLGAGVASVVAQNLGSIPGVTTLSRAVTAPYDKRRNDLAGIARDLGATYVLDLTLKSATPKPELLVRLRRPGARAPDWEQTIEGDALDVERRLLAGVADALERAGVWPGGLSAADRARIARLPTTSGEALLAYSQARALLDRYDVTGNIERSMRLLDQAIARDPRFALAHAARGDAFWRQYERDKDTALATRATDAIREALRIDPDEAPIYQSLGNMQLVTGRYDDALRSLRRALDLQPGDDETHRLLGRVLLERGRIDAAVDEIRRAIRIRPEYWNHHNTLGFAYYRAGRYREALDAYRKTAEVQPTYAGAFQMLGTIHHVLGDLPQAIGNYEHAVRLGPNAAAYANLAFAYYGAKRYDDALAAYDKSLSANPRSVVNRRNIGDVYARVGRTGKARAEWRQAIAIGNEQLAVNPQDYRTIALVALCEAKLGQAASAERHAAEARALAPGDREIQQRSAEVHAMAGHSAAALADLGAAIALGYTRREARGNEELAPLRRLPAFQKLVADRP